MAAQHHGTALVFLKTLFGLSFQCVLEVQCDAVQALHLLHCMTGL